MSRRVDEPRTVETDTVAREDRAADGLEPGERTEVAATRGRKVHGKDEIKRNVELALKANNGVRFHV